MIQTLMHKVCPVIFLGILGGCGGGEEDVTPQQTVLHPPENVTCQTTIPIPPDCKLNHK